MEPADLADLPQAVQAAARILPNGEVEWAWADAEAAVTALVAAGHIVLGLDTREYDASGNVFETPWTVFEPDKSASQSVNAANSRERAIEALIWQDRRPAPYVLITWD